MEIPFTPKFFKKLAIYQEIKIFPKKTENKKRWPHIEKILVWTIENHQNLSSPLSRKRLKEIYDEIDISNRDIDKDIGNLVFYGFAEPTIYAIKRGKKYTDSGEPELIQMFHEDKIFYKKEGKDIHEYWQSKKLNNGEDLGGKDIIEQQETKVEAIIFTEKGLEYGEILFAVRNGKGYFYKLVTCLIWLLIIAASLIVFDNLLESLFDVGLKTTIGMMLKSWYFIYKSIFRC